MSIAAPSASDHKTPLVVSCSGDRESPHPKIYVRLAPPKVTFCPYCGKKLTPPARDAL